MQALCTAAKYLQTDFRTVAARESLALVYLIEGLSLFEAGMKIERVMDRTCASQTDMEKIDDLLRYVEF